MFKVYKGEFSLGIEFAYGRAGSGKSRFVLSRIGERLKDPLKKTVVIVPEQYTFQMERDIFDVCKVPGFIGLSVLGFKRLVFRILEEAGGRAKESLNAAAKSMVVRLAVQQNGGNLKAFKKSARQPGFDVKMAELLSDLKRFDIDADTLLSKAPGLSAPYLREKAEDIGRIYKTYEALMQGRSDAEDLVNIAIENIGEADFLKGAYVVIDGFDLLTGQLKRLIKKLMELSDGMLVTFRMGREEDPDAGLFSPEQKVLEELKAHASAKGIPVVYKRLPDGDFPSRYAHPELSHLEKNLYAYPYKAYGDETKCISLFAAKNRISETLFAAENIFRLVRSGNYRYRDIAVLTDTEAYADIVKSTFMANGIPCFVDSKRELYESKPAVLVDAALGLVAGKWKIGEIVRLIKTGLTGLDEAEAEALLNCRREFGLRGYAFQKPFRYGGSSHLRLCG